MKQSSPLKWCRQFAVAALAVSLTVPVARGQETAPANVSTNVSRTLDALVVEALEKNPELKFYEAEITAAKGGRKTAGLFANPALAAANADLRAQDARVDLAKAQRIPDVKVEVLYRRLEASKENTFDVGLSIPLPLFDRNQGRIREARAEHQAAEARSRSTKNELSLRLQDSYAQLTTALATSRALQTEILPRADTVLKSAEARYAAGDTSLSDVLPVRRDWAAVQLTYLESLRDVMQAWSTVRSLAGAN